MKRHLRIRVETGVPWPTKETVVRFRDHDFTLAPETDTLASTVLLEYESGKITQDEALLLVRQFLSSLSWAEGAPIEDGESADGSRPMWIGKGSGRVVSPNFRADYLPDPADPKARLALALFREALGVNSTPYRFLGFAKVLNIRYAAKKDQVTWINATVGKLQDHQANVRLAEIRALGQDVGEYLYVSGRCAVAHAFADPVVDPENPEDRRRLNSDLPLIKALAAHLIEYEMGVKSHATIWREHLYELNGFRDLLGGVVDRLRRGETVTLGEMPSLPRLSMRVRGQQVMEGFEALKTMVVDILAGQRLVIKCESADGLVEAVLVLNFGQERLKFDPFEDFRVGDDGSPGAVRHAIDGVEMRRALLLNGQLEVWDAEGGALLGRTDPYVGVNIDLSATADGLERLTAELDAELQRRLGSTGPAPSDTSAGK